MPPKKPLRSPAIRINNTDVVKKDKDKAQDLNYIKCYTCKQKDHYTNKYPEKLKNERRF